MIVRLNFKSHSPALTHIDNSGIFLASFYQNLTDGILIFFLGGKKPEQFPGIFVRAMLRPHHRKNSQLSEIGRATKNFQNLIILLRQEAMLCNQLGSNFNIQTGIRIGGKRCGSGFHDLSRKFDWGGSKQGL